MNPTVQPEGFTPAVGQVLPANDCCRRNPPLATDQAVRLLYLDTWRVNRDQVDDTISPRRWSLVSGCFPDREGGLPTRCSHSSRTEADIRVVSLVLSDRSLRTATLLRYKSKTSARSM